MKEGVHHACIACVSIDSVMKMDKENNPQVNLEEYKYKIRKNMSKFIYAELELDSNSNSDSE